MNAAGIAVNDTEICLVKRLTGNSSFSLSNYQNTNDPQGHIRITLIISMSILQ